MHTAVAKVIIMIICCAIVFMLINMNRIMYFMTAFLIPWHANAGAISRPFKDGEHRAEKHKNQDCSAHSRR